MGVEYLLLVAVERNHQDNSQLDLSVKKKQKTVRGRFRRALILSTRL